MVASSISNLSIDIGFQFQVTEKLKKAKQACDLQQYLFNYYSLKVEKGEKDYDATSQKLTSLFLDLEVLDHQIGHSKTWI